MTISIVLQTATSASVTRVPGWFARWLLGREESTVLVHRVRMLGFAHDGVSPRYAWIEAPGCEVEPDVSDAIDRALTLRPVRERRERLVRR